MSGKILLGGLLAAGAVAGMVHLYQESTGVRYLDHERFEAGLQQVQQFNSSFERDLLKTRFRLLSDYDSLSPQLDRCMGILRRLDEVPEFVTRQAADALRDTFAMLRDSLEEKVASTEHWKSQNSVVRNSLAYFPVLEAKLAAVGMGDPDRDHLRLEVGALVHTVLVFTLTEDPGLVPEIRSQAERLGSWIATHAGHPDNELVSSLTAHAKVLYTRLPALDEAMRHILALPTSSHAEKAMGQYTAEFARALDRTESYRLVLFLCAIALAGAVAWALLALRAANHGLEARVIRRTAELDAKAEELRASEQRFRTLSNGSPVGIFAADENGHYTYANPRCETILGMSAEDMGAGGWAKRLHPDDSERVRAQWQKAVSNRSDFVSEHRFVLADSRVRWVHVRSSANPSETGRAGQIGMVIDISERKTAEDQRAEMELQLHHAQKLESVGRLASGVAHEINTPTQFIGDNVRFLRDAFADLDRLIDASKELLAAIDTPQRDAATGKLAELQQQVDFQFLRAECPVAIAQSLDGVDRVAKIVHAMKDFAHADRAEKAVVDVNRAIRSAITVCRNEWKYIAEVVEQLDESSPTVLGYAQDLGQVVLNLVVNAAHAIAEKDTGKGVITIRSRTLLESVVVEIEDSGAGIPETVKPRIFEQFFTTKPVGKGTGQGLALAHRIVTGKHGGQISFDSAVGRGTTFQVILPKG